jgi:hypothetical protein
MSLWASVLMVLTDRAGILHEDGSSANQERMVGGWSADEGRMVGESSADQISARLELKKIGLKIGLDRNSNLNSGFRYNRTVNRNFKFQVHLSVQPIF